jgi:rhodanese-related sulfurtransferase
MKRLGGLNLRMWFVLVLAIVLPLACGDSEVKRIPKEELKSMLGDPNLVIIDVRLPAHWDENKLKIVGAVHEDIRPVKYWMDKYPKERTLVFYCA